MSGSTILHDYLPGVQALDQAISATFGRGVIDPSTTGNATHVIMSILVSLFVMLLAALYAARRKMAADTLIPERTLNARSVVETICEAAFGLMEGIMGREAARSFLPLIGTLAFFILFGNLAGLVPGLLPPTEVISTNLVLALIVFLATHLYGIKKNGLEHIKHMMGPMRALSPLVFPIELISHFARPLSLTLRLFGNMVGDHTVLTIFLSFGLLLVPLPVMFLGTIVCVVQTLVFCLLSVVYISMAIEDLHEHH